ncbi:hypothetical protein SM033_00248 [Vibrio phage vB_VpaM_sm033]|nr:hypothetical protein SM033_00248 [Vibrio phage vB_VpaM_sm033]
MAKALIAVDQTDITISQSIMRDTVKSLIAQTGFDPAAKIIFNDDTVDSPRHIKNMFDKCTETDGTRTQYMSYVFAEYTDRTTEDGWAQSQRRRHLTRPLFEDKAIGVTVRPMYLEHEAKMTLRFRSNSRTKMTHWLNILKTTDVIKTHLGYIDISYDYQFPNEFLDFIVDAYDAMDDYPEPTPDLKTYLQEHFRSDIQKRKNLNGSAVDIVAFEVLKNVEGQADDQGFWNEQEIQNGIYEVTLNYTFRYERIVAVEMIFPAIIYNRFIKKEYVERFHHHFRLRNDDNYDRPITFIDGDLRSYEVNYYYIGDGGSRMVPWDDFFPEFPNPTTQTVSLFPFQVDLDNPRDVCNISDLSHDYVPEAIHKYINEQKDFINVINGSLVAFEVYSVGEDEEMIMVEIDDDYNIKTTRDMDGKRRHYMRVTLKKNIPSLHPDRLRYLLTMGQTAVDIFKLYDPTLETTTDAADWQRRVGFDMTPGRDKTIPSLLMMAGDNITDYSFTRWVRKLDSTDEWFVNLRPMMPKYVGQYNITASR